MAERDQPVTDDELFGYATGELDGAARTRIQGLLQADPTLRARLAWYEAVCDGVVHSVAPLEGLASAEEILARIRARPRKTGFFAWLAGPALKPAAAFAALLILAQGLVIGMLMHERSETAAVRSAGAPRTVILAVAFDPETRESAIRSLLLQAGARIVDGPRQLGEYRLAVPANRVDFVTSLLKQSNVVEYVRQEKQ